MHPHAVTRINSRRSAEPARLPFKRSTQRTTSTRPRLKALSLAMSRTSNHSKPSWILRLQSSILPRFSSARPRRHLSKRRRPSLPIRRPLKALFSSYPTAKRHPKATEQQESWNSATLRIAPRWVLRGRSKDARTKIFVRPRKRGTLMKSFLMQRLSRTLNTSRRSMSRFRALFAIALPPLRLQMPSLRHLKIAGSNRRMSLTRKLRILTPGLSFVLSVHC